MRKGSGPSESPSLSPLTITQYTGEHPFPGTRSGLSVSYTSSHSQAGSPQPHPGPAAPAPSLGHSAPSCPSCHPAGAGEGGQDMQAAGYPLIALAAQWRRGGGHPRSTSGSVLGAGEGTGKPPNLPMKQGMCNGNPHSLIQTKG